MKKILLMFILSVVVLSLIGCEPVSNDVVEPIQPQILGLEDVVLTVGDAFDPMEGVTAEDEKGVDITHRVLVSGLENLLIINGRVVEAGTYELTYIVIDYKLNRVEKTRAITVLEEVVFIPPTINGVVDLKLLVGSPFNPLKGVVAFDEKKNDITSSITISGLEELELDGENRLTKAGEYTLTYTAIDSSGIEASETRVINIYDAGVIDSSVYGCLNQWIGDYVITWCDEFTGNGDHLNAYGVDLNKWGFQLGTGSQYGLNRWGNYEEQYYREENTRVEDGRLIIEARQERFGGMNYTSSRLYTYPTFAQKYGRFEASIKLPAGQGFWPAFWLMPRDSVYGTWAASGEIDIMEARGRIPTQTIGAIHYGGRWPHNTHTAFTYPFPKGYDITDFNQYAIEWEPGIIRWYVNGNLFGTATNWYSSGHDFPAPFDQEFYIILNLAIGGTFDGGRVPESSMLPATMEVEYVRVYAKQSYK